MTNVVGDAGLGAGPGRGARPALVHQAVDRLLDQVLALGVHLAGGLVEDQDRGVAQDGAGDADAAASGRRRAGRPARRACVS